VAVAKPALAVLSGQVSQAVIGSTSRVSLNLQIRAMADTGFENRWGANVEGEYRKSFWEVLSDLLARVTLTHVVIGLILVGGLVFFRWFTRSF
jgi:hypothetical protein